MTTQATTAGSKSQDSIFSTLHRWVTPFTKAVADVVRGVTACCCCCCLCKCLCSCGRSDTQPVPPESAE